MFSQVDLITAMKQDKKRVGEGLVMVMITDTLELLKADDVTTEEVETALSSSFK